MSYILRDRYTRIQKRQRDQFIGDNKSATDPKMGRPCRGWLRHFQSKYHATTPLIIITKHFGL